MSEANNMARKHEEEINFSETWGGKIELDIFKTVRGQDKIYDVGRIYPCTLIAGLFHKKKNIGLHRLLNIEWQRIRDFTVTQIIADIGRARAGSDPKHTFLKIMRAFYGKKGWWDGEYTVLQRITLEKLGKKGMIHFDLQARAHGRRPQGIPGGAP